MVLSTHQIVNESETQRQFIRLQIPAWVEIENTRYSIKDLSNGGVSLRDIQRPLKRGQKLTLKLVLPFEDFSLDIVLNAEVQYHDKKLQLAGCRFSELTPQQIGILTHVIKSFMAGDIIRAGDILAVASRDPFVNIRKNASNEDVSKWQTARQVGIYVLIILACMTMAYFILSNMLDRLYIIKSGNGVINAPVVTVIAPASGLFSPSLLKGVSVVRAGQVIGKILPMDRINNISVQKFSNEISVRSPCDCYIADSYAMAGEYKAQGASLYKLIPHDSDIYVSALISVDDAHRIRTGTEAVLKISGTQEQITGKVSDIRASDRQVLLDDMESTSLGAEVRILPEAGLIPDYIGRPVYVEFHL